MSNVAFTPAVEGSVPQDGKGLPSPGFPQAPTLPATPPMSQTLWSPPPQTFPYQHMITQSTLVDHMASSATTSLPTRNSNSDITTSTSNTDNLVPPPFHRTPTFAASPIRSPELQFDPSATSSVHGLVNVPSLSQSYPQDLDYEHGLELLSPPSSRSISPFSMGGMSPHPSATNDISLRALSPFDNIPSRSASSMSNLSSVMSSPAVIPTNVRSPLMMELGNESYDTLSPVALQARQIEQPQRGPLAAVSPFLDPSPVQRHSETLSATNSARSTTYLSFDEDEDERDSMSRGSPQPYANLGGNIGAEGTFGPASVYQSMHQSQLSQTSVRASTSTMHNGPFLPVQRNSTSSSSLASGELRPEGQGLGLSFFPTQSQVGSRTQNSVRQVPAYSDSDLSDLDLMSDYTQSEVSGSDVGDISDIGEQQQRPSRGPGYGQRGATAQNIGPMAGDDNDSDSSWSLAGSPVMGNLDRGGTIRASRAARGGYGMGGR